jgi:predicted PurR-regulated permease PerM
MNDSLNSLKPWLTFAGCILVVVVLSWAESVLVPIALATLLTFVLTPPVRWLERWIGRVPATLGTVLLVFSVLGLAGWGLTLQLDQLAVDLPQYRVNINAKIKDLRGAGKGGSVEKLQETITEIIGDLKTPDKPAPAAARPVTLAPPPPAGVPGFAWVNTVIGPLSTAGLVVTMVIFMLLDRRDLRDRLIRLFGHGQLATTTEAFNEVGARVSRQLLMQSLVSVIYGVVAAGGLYALDVPYPFVCAALAAALRFVPYIGPVIGAGTPILVTLAATDGWSSAIWVGSFLLGLELFTNLVLETVLYSSAAGISPVALLLSVAFWTWLWGPLGLLIATPLTVCLVVLSKNVQGLEPVATLLGDAPVMPPELPSGGRE